MKRLVLIGAALSSFALGSSAYAQNGPFELQEYGIGKDSCGNWLSTEFNKGQGEAWIFGYWTGLNEANTNDHMVGSTTDGQGIVAAVEKACGDDPTQNLVSAAGSVYHRLFLEHR